MPLATSKSYWCLVGSFGFALDQELAGEADLLRVIDRHVQEGGEVILLALEIGVEQGSRSPRARPRRRSSRPPSSFVVSSAFFTCAAA